MPDGSLGFQSRLSMAATGTAIGSYTEAYEFVSESVRKSQQILDTAGIRGSRSHPKERTRDGTYTVQGTIRLHATPSMLALLLPRILGANASGTTFALAETLPEFDLLIDRVARRFVYGNCKIGKATFRCQAGGLLELELEVQGKTEADSATSFPSISAPTDIPYVWSDATCTLLSTSRIVTQWELAIDNVPNVRFSNSQSATDIQITDRIVTCSLMTPYTSDETDLYGQNVASSAAATFSLTNGGTSISFAIANLQIPDNSPVVESRTGEIMLSLQGTAKMSGSTRELIVTNDSTP
jgi:hypothetical protein